VALKILPKENLVSSSALSIYPFVSQDAGDGDWVAFNRFLNLIQSEALPDDPPVPIEETRRGWSNLPTIIKRSIWTVVDDTDAVIYAYACDMMQTEENQHLTVNQIAVVPEMRLKGIGTQLLSIFVRLRARSQDHALLRPMIIKQVSSLPSV
jgi:GNAT superfamily N-acetyltransferase